MPRYPSAGDESESIIRPFLDDAFVAQMSAEAKAKRAGFVLDNNGDRGRLEALVRAELLPWLRRRVLLPWRLCSLPGMAALLLALLAMRGKHAHTWSGQL